MIKATLPMVPTGLLDHDMAANDAIIELLKLLNPLPNLCLHGRGRVEITECDLNWYLHERSPF
jgi:hypothetical protein